MDKIEETLGRLVGVVEDFVAGVSAVKIDTDWHQETERRIQETERWKLETERRIHQLEESQDDGWDRLNALIKIVDDIFRNRPPN